MKGPGHRYGPTDSHANRYVALCIGTQAHGEACLNSGAEVESDPVGVQATSFVDHMCSHRSTLRIKRALWHVHDIYLHSWTALWPLRECDAGRPEQMPVLPHDSAISWRPDKWSSTGAHTRASDLSDLVATGWITLPRADSSDGLTLPLGRCWTRPVMARPSQSARARADSCTQTASATKQTTTHHGALTRGARHEDTRRPQADLPGTGANSPSQSWSGSRTPSVRRGSMARRLRPMMNVCCLSGPVVAGSDRFCAGSNLIPECKAIKAEHLCCAQLGRAV